VPEISPRRTGNRCPRNVVVVVTEGRTEKIYFNGLKQRSCNVEIKTPGTSPTDAINLVKFCVRQIEENGLDLDEGDAAICVFDIEGNPAANLKKAMKLANENGITLAVTNPCFELWYLLHFIKVDHKVTCGDAQTLLKRFIKGYNKTTDYRGVLGPKHAPAMRNADDLWEHHGLGDKVQPSQPNPSTSVHLAVRAIEALIKRNTGH